MTLTRHINSSDHLVRRTAPARRRQQPRWLQWRLASTGMGRRSTSVCVHHERGRGELGAADTACRPARETHPGAGPWYTVDETAECGHNDYMERNLVGARELKARLGTYLRRVRHGRTLVVTDRGEPVAELRPLPSGTDAGAVLAKLKATGAVTRISDKPLAAFRPVKSRGASAAAAVLEDREDRF
jgi:prevent-host-death family protein